MIKLNNVKSYFNSTIDLNNDSVLEIWNKFKSFCLVDVENEDDREILFETGVEKIEGIKYFYVNFVRQFMMEMNMMEWNNLFVHFILNIQKSLDF